VFFNTFEVSEIILDFNYTAGNLRYCIVEAALCDHFETGNIIHMTTKSLAVFWIPKKQHKQQMTTIIKYPTHFYYLSCDHIKRLPVYNCKELAMYNLMGKRQFFDYRSYKIIKFSFKYRFCKNWQNGTMGINFWSFNRYHNLTWSTVCPFIPYHEFSNQ